MGQCCSEGSKHYNIAEELIISILSSFKICSMSYYEFINIVEEFDSKVINCSEDDLFILNSEKTEEMNNTNNSENKKSNNTQIKYKHTDKTSNNKEEMKSQINSQRKSSFLIINPTSPVSKYIIDLNKLVINDKNLKVHLNAFIKSNFLDSTSNWYSYQEMLMPLLDKVNKSNYKILLFSWALGFLNYQSKNEDESEKYKIFSKMIEYLFQNDVDKSYRIKEFISYYANYNLFYINNIIINSISKKFQSVVNGYFINVELMEMLKHIREDIFNSKKLIKINNFLISSLKYTDFDNLCFNNINTKTYNEFSKYLNSLNLRKIILNIENKEAS